MKRRLLSFLLCICMVITMLPATAYAALLDNEPATNREILAQLEAICGSEEEAERYYALLQQYGLLDEDGSVMDSWTITMDGADVKLSDLRAVLAGDYDPTKLVIVDGTPITLGDLDTVLQIEDYIAYLRRTYFSGGKWTAEQLASLQSLQEQINTRGIMLLGVNDEGTVGASGVDHTVRISVSGADTATLNSSYTVTVSLNKAQKVDVTYSYRALSGSVAATGSGTGTIAAGDVSSTFTVNVGDAKGVLNGSGTFVVQVYDVKNALFSDGQDNGSLTVRVSKSDTFKYSDSKSLSIDYKGNSYYCEIYTRDNSIEDEKGDSSIKNQTDPVEQVNQTVTFNSLSEGTYQATIGLGTMTFRALDPYNFWQTYPNALNVMSTSTYQITANGTVFQEGTVQLNKDTTFASVGASNNTLPQNRPVQGASSSLTFKVGVNLSRLYYLHSKPSYMRNYCLYHVPEFATSGSITVTEVTTSATATASAPAGTYSAGQVIPITVKFSFPMQISSSMQLTVNGQTMTPVETGTTSDHATFLYTVPAVDNTSLMVESASLSGTGANGKSITVSGPSVSAISGVTLTEPEKAAAITGFTAVINNPTTAPSVTVTANISNDGKLTQWLTAELTPIDGTYTSQSLFVSVDNINFKPLTTNSETVTGGTMTAVIDLPLNTGADPVTVMPELYLKDGDTYQVIFGRYASLEQAPAVFIEQSDLSMDLSVMQSDGTTEYEYADATKTIYLQDGPKVTAAYTLSTGKTYSFAGTDQFEWKSSDPTVANIDQDGVITPTGKAGPATFTLTAKNGDVVVDGVRKAVTVTAGTLTFGVGLTPFLNIPNNAITSTSGQDVTVYWTSNLCDKNGDTPTTFAVTVKRGSEAVYSTEVKGTASAPAASVTIPGSVLTYDYSENGTNRFTVEVSSTYANRPYTATASISLESKPAVVTFDKLSSYYLTDTAPVTIGWSISNFDRYSSEESGTLFKFEVMKNGTSVYSSNDPGSGSGSFTGSYTLRDVSVTAGTDPNSYRDVYTVTIQAKNGTDSTWSYDSFLLYVYDADALKIWVDGEDESSVTMSNVQRISQMDQTQILALKRDINLKNIISVNYGQYAWSEIADQIKWKSSDSKVASVNYQQGTLYENIENFSYVSYRPTTEFGLSGLKDGTVTVTATHKLAGMSDTLHVTVETLKDKLYLFQCYPQTETTLTYTNGTGVQKSVRSDASGAAAIYEESGIASDVYCSAVSGGAAYLGTFYKDTLKTGEGDWTKLERYPCNNLTLRRAAYAYLYLKDPDGEPYTGSITFRGGVYVNGEYKSGAKFELNNSGSVSLNGAEDQTVRLGSDGKLTVVMDQTQWGLASGSVQASDRVEYVFEIAQRNGVTTYYPTFVSINASANQDAFVGSGSAVVNFRKNTGTGEHPFIAMQSVKYDGSYLNVLDSKGSVGPSDSYPEASLTTVVMWWGEDMTGKTPTLRLKTDTGIPIADGEGESTITQTDYPFASGRLTSYTVMLNDDTLFGVVPYKDSAALELEYYADGSTLSRKEAMSFKLTNLLGVGAAESSSALLGELRGMGNAMGTSADTSGMNTNDMFVNILLKMVASDSYTTGSDGLFSLQLAPTSDPTKFLGFISLCGGGMNDADQVSKINAREDTSNQADFDYTPGLGEMMVLVGLKKPLDYAMDQMDDFNKVLKRKGVSDKTFGISGYMESLIYYDFTEQEWTIQILNGGFKAGGGLSYAWNFNTMCGPVPVTATFTAGGSVDIGMDALSVAYYNKTSGNTGMGNDFLTELRLYLYLRAFAGVGFDYSVVAFKLGIFGQINLEMQFQWLNRPYMESDGSVVNVADGRYDGNLNGQHYKMDGQVGLEFLVKFLFISYERVLCSYSFNAFDKSTGKWSTIQESWADNQAASRKALDELINSGSVSVTSVGGQQMLSLNLAPTLEDRDYLEDGSFWNDGSVGLFALDETSALKNLQYNAYPYADPVVSDDGQLVVYLSDMDSTAVERTRAAFVTRSGTSYQMGGDGTLTAIHDAGYGDSQLSLAGTDSFAVAAWTRQSDTVSKDGGAVLTAEDQMIMMNSSEVCVSIYNGSGWATTQLSSNATPDLAPVVATNGKSGSEARAIVAWRAVSSGSAANLTTFDERDTILYSVYDGSRWSAAQTLYNGTSGMVKAIVAAMLEDGTAAVAYTLDTDSTDSTTSDREIVYAVVGTDGQVSRNVRATNDGYLDENPQLTAVNFGTEQRFVLGWYTEQAVASDSPSVLDGGGRETANQTVSDLRLLDFNADGVTEQRLPDSISQVADAYGVSITSNFRFTKGSKSINDLSILWVERAEGETRAVTGESNSVGENADLSALKSEKDVLKGVKFYTYGQNNELIGFTGAVDVAEMPDSTLIDHFDSYVSNAASNEIKAVILGTTYGENGAVTRTGETVGGTTVEYTVPSRTTSMYTATETYQDKIEVPALYVDYQTVKLGAKTQIQFTIDNRGIHAIDRLDITVGGQTTTYEDLNLLPGGSIQLYADYTVPAGGVVDPDYTVQACFNTNAGASGSAETTEATGYALRRTVEDLTQASGKVYLDLPDIAITDASIVREENGERTIQIKLNNQDDAALTQGEHKVRLSFYSDAACEKSIGNALQPITITTAADFGMINEGGYSVQTTFDVGEYVKAENGTVQEIPEDGVKVYIKAEVLDNGGAVQGEPVYSNNYASITCDNLKVRTGKDVTLNSDLTANASGSTVTVTLQNNRLTQTATGNLIVTLLDEKGQVIASQQSYTGAESGNGLIALNGEQKLTKTFTFTQQGASVQVAYSDVILGADNANLTSLTFSNIPGVTLESFTPGEDGIYRASVSADDLTSTAVMAVAESGLAKVRMAETDAGNNVLSKTVALVPGETSQIAVTVTANNGSTKTYILTVQNNGEPVINDPTGSPEPGESSQYSASTFYAADSAVISLTAAASGSYALSYQWYSCDADGGNAVLLQDETASTLTIPDTTAVGVYYYLCKVTRQLLSGSTTDYWSSVASVQINKATDNSVTLKSAVVTFDNAAHGLTGAVAAKAGSTLHYSTDGGQTWSEDPPTFTSVGVHTVWAYASNPNYEDTAVVTADMVIQEKEGTLFKLETSEISTVYSGYPQAIRDQYSSPEELTAALKSEVTKLGAPENDTVVYEIQMLFSLDDGTTWQYATAENFPAAGVTVKLPYPEGTNRYSCNFILKHLITDPLRTGKTVGDFETMDLTLEEDGIRFTADCLSPFVLGWYPRSSSSHSGYKVAVGETEHGTVTVNSARAAYNSTVTITAKPDDGYKVGAVTVTTQNGRELTVTEKGKNSYTFKMPSGSVSVEVTFVPIACDGGDRCPTHAFTDLSADAWYHEAVDYVLDNGLMGGYGSGRFGPNDTLSRAQLAQILYNREGRPAVSNSGAFNDVPGSMWCADAVTWANANGIVGGYGNGSFGPNDSITREQLAVMLWRYAGSPATSHSLDRFTDADRIGGYARVAIAWANEHGIVNGYGNGTLNPKGRATRAQVAQMLMNFLRNLNP